MKKAVIIHGYYDRSEYLDSSYPSASNNHWIPWLQRQLSLKGIETQTPEMPGFYEPNYERWKEMLDRFTPDENTILVGHSLGGGFLVRYLSETKSKFNKVVLVAPWLDPRHKIDPKLFDFSIDPEIVSRTNELNIIYSTDDFSDVLQSVDILKSKLEDAKFIEFKDKGHFVLNSLHTEKFPELLETIIS
jgi:predicted alpha/beta hydrolase family esterase